MSHFAIQIMTLNDRDGNPRRGLKLFDSTNGSYTGFITNAEHKRLDARRNPTGILRITVVDTLRVPVTEYNHAVIESERIGFDVSKYLRVKRGYKAAA